MKQTITTFLTSEKGIYIDALVLVSIPTIILLISTPFLDLVICVLLVLIYSWLQGGIGKNLGFLKPDKPGKLFLQSLGIAFVFFISTAIIGLVLTSLTGVPHDLSAFEAMRGNLAVYIPTLAIGWVVGGFIEEVLFRAFMIKKINRLLGGKPIANVLAALLPAIFFGFLHAYQGLIGQILAGLIGLALAVLYIKNKHNTWQNVLVHGLFDTIAITTVYLNLDRMFG